MTMLGNGLFLAKNYEDAMSVQEAELSMKRRIGASEKEMLVVQANLASTYRALGQFDRALRMWQEAFSGRLKLLGEENATTLLAANNYAHGLLTLKRYAEAKALLRKMMPVARRVLGENDVTTIRIRLNYGWALYKDTGATLDDLREAVTTLDDSERIARRVLGGSHPLTMEIKQNLQNARAALRAREAPWPGGSGA